MVQHARLRTSVFLASRRTVAGLIAVMLAAVLPSVVTAQTASASPTPISVTMNASSNPVASGSSLTYTIVTTNSEPQVTNVGLSDQLTGLTNVVLSSSRGFCTLSSQLVTCSAGSMPGQGETWTVTIMGLVTANSGTFLNNTATVTADWSDQNTSQNFAVPATTSVLVNNNPSSALPDLSVSIAGPSTAAAGSNATLQLTVNNSGGANATDIQVNATLPAGFSIQPGQFVSGTSLFGCTTSLPVITCIGGAVNQGANATITVPVVVSSTSPPPGGSLSYVTTAVVDPENAIPESNELNNTSSWTLTVPTSPPPTQPITLTKTAVSTVDPTGAQVRPNDTLTYTIKVTNTSPSKGGSSATRVMVTDGTQGLDQAAVTAKSSDPKLICTNNASLVTCNAANNSYTLNAGATVTVTVSGRVVQPPSSIITNTATLQTLQNKVSITRTASFTTIVRPTVDLTVTQYATCTPQPPSPGAPSLLPCPPFRARNQFDYLITVGNSGLNDAGPSPDVVLREPLPNDVIFESYDNLSPSGGFTCGVDANNVLTCSGGTVPGQLSSNSYPGTTRQIRIHLTAPNSIGPITSTVTVNPYNAIPESDTSNDTATTTTQIQTGINLTVTQAVRCPRDTRSSPLMCDPVAPSGTLIYDILVTNVGSQDATGINVNDILPAGARFRSAKEVPNIFGAPYAPAHGLSCGLNGSNPSEVDCTGGRLLGSYAMSGGPHIKDWFPTVKFDQFTIEVTAFAPAPYGPNSSPNATGSPILNQAIVDPANTIPEYNENDNLNILETNVGIPTPPFASMGDWGTYNELTVNNVQTSPTAGMPVAPNGTLQYTLTVSNWGSDPASNVTVYDYVPTGARFRDATAKPLINGTGGFGCSFNNGLVACTNGALAASPGVGVPTSTTITILLFAPPTVNATTTQYTNHAVIDPNNAIPEADETNNISDVSLTVALPNLGAPPLGGQNDYNEFTVDNVQTNPVDGGGNPVPVAPNGTLEYTLTAKNWGTDPAFGVTVFDYLPQAARFRDVTVQPGSGFVCNFNSGLVSCNNGTIAKAPVEDLVPATASIKILLFAPDTPNNIGTNKYTNHAVINPNNTVPEADVSNDATDATLVVAYPPTGQNPYNEFTVKSEQAFPTAGGAVAPSGTLIYRLTVPNTGTDTAVNVPVRDFLPTGTTFRLAKLNKTLSTAGVTGFVCTQSSGVVDCTNGTIPSGGQAVIDIVLFAPAQPTSPDPGNPNPQTTTITNQALVNPGNAVPEADPTNDTDSTDTTVKLGGAGGYWDFTTDLSMSDMTGTPDNNVTYKLTVKNVGTDDAFNVSVSDVLPAGTTFVSALDTAPGAGAFTCADDSNNPLDITCSGGTLPGTLNGGASREIDIVAKAPHANITITDQATADPTNAFPEADETNNSTSVSTVIKSLFDLATTITDSGTTGAGNTFTITGHITSTADATGPIAFEMDLPVGITPLNVDLSNAPNTSCQIFQNPISKIVCTSAAVPQSPELQIVASVYSNTDDTKSVNAIVNGDNKVIESDDGSDTNDTFQLNIT
jgi:uncharacterized repeat protein (TIGR01451 family)